MGVEKLQQFLKTSTQNNACITCTLRPYVRTLVPLVNSFLYHHRSRRQNPNYQKRHYLKMKSEADRCQTFEKWPVGFIDKINQQEADFITQTRVRLFEALFLNRKWISGKVIIYTRTSNGGVGFLGSLQVSSSGTSLLVLPTDPKQHLNSLPEAANSVF